MRAALLLASVALALAATPAQAAPADVAATHAYIMANYALAHASVAREASAQAKVQNFTEGIAGRCPGAGAGSLQTEEAQRMSYEMAGALWSIGFRTAAAPIAAFARTVGRLHWHDPALARAAARYVRDLTGLAHLRTPDVCSDVLAWKANGFTTIPSTTNSFDKRVEALEPKAIGAKLLARYEQPGDRALVRRTAHLELELEENEFEVGFDDWAALLRTLGLQQ